MDEVTPATDDIVIPKTSSGVFNSTNIDYVLRNLGIENVVVTGSSPTSASTWRSEMAPIEAIT